MNSDDVRAWAAVPWKPVAGDTDGAPIGWTKRSVPYKPGATSLQTLDVWIPRHLPSSPTSTSTLTSPAVAAAAAAAAGAVTQNLSAPPSPAALLPLAPGRRRHWIVFIHGGAWCDPRIASQSFSAAAMHLLRHAGTASSSSSSSSSSLAGLVSLNYRLSPHPDKLPPSGDAADAGYIARHPDHVADVLAGLAFVRRLMSEAQAVASAAATTATAAAEKEEDHDAGNDRLVLAGHSCGAMLAFQAVMDPGRWGFHHSLPHTPSSAAAQNVQAARPDVIVGFSGLYDLAGFVADPPASHAGGGLVQAYRQFTGDAFGPDERVWRAACPATAEGDWAAEEWSLDGRDEEREEGTAPGTTTGKRKTVVLAQSREDELVPYQQLESLRMCLERSRGAIEVCEKRLTGKHDEVWQKGDELAEVLEEVAEQLGRK